MRTRKLYIIAYDIKDDKTRTKIAEFLERFGTRRNYSVFECVITAGQYRQILTAMKKYIDPSTDILLVFPVCKTCYARHIQIGKGGTDEGTIYMIS